MSADVTGPVPTSAAAPATRPAAERIRTGLTLYSLTPLFWSHRYDLEGLLDQVAERDLGPGVEIVGFQSIPTYPDVEASFVRRWREGLERRGLVGSCLSSNIDVGAPRGRVLTDDEMVASLTRQIEVAHALGMGVIRIQIGACPSVIERCLPVAERLGVRMGMELHAPESPCTPAIVAVRELYARLDSPYVGFVPDFSATMRAIPQRWVRKLVDGGLPEAMVPRLRRIWGSALTMGERVAAWAEACQDAGVPRAVSTVSWGTFSMFGTHPVDDWREIAGQVVHVHGKCYQFDADGQEPTMDYPRILRVLADGGYEGFVSAEWEGHAFFEPQEVDPFEMVAAQQALVRSCLEQEG